MQFTVFGMYAENLQRHSGVVEARNPTHAEQVYRESTPETMLISAVLVGEHVPIDSKEYGNE